MTMPVVPLLCRRTAAPSINGCSAECFFENGVRGRALYIGVKDNRPAHRCRFGLAGGLGRSLGLLSCRCGLAATRVCDNSLPLINTRWPLPPHSVHSTPAISPVPWQGSHGIGTFSAIVRWPPVGNLMGGCCRGLHGRA